MQTDSMTYFDLHIHTTASDGALTPTELVKYAVEQEVSVLSITDHDTIFGLDEALVAGKEVGVEIISGIELSVENEDGSMHLLVYGFNHAHKFINEIIANLRYSRIDRNNRLSPGPQPSLTNGLLCL